MALVDSPGAPGEELESANEVELDEDSGMAEC